MMQDDTEATALRTNEKWTINIVRRSSRFVRKNLPLMLY